MGFLERFFGKAKDFPELEPSNPITGKIDKIKNELETLTKEVSDTIEIVPGEQAAYVFIGKPPKKFGFAMIHNGKVLSVKNLMDERGIPDRLLQKISDNIRDVYKSNEPANRFMAPVGSRKIIVNPSTSLKNGLDKIIKEASAS